MQVTSIQSVINIPVEDRQDCHTTRPLTNSGSTTSPCPLALQTLPYIPGYKYQCHSAA